MTNTASRELRACAAAFTFLTRLPAHRLIRHDASDLGRASAYFPLVGLVIGLVGGAVYAGARLFWASALAVILSAGATVWATGAFHEDALADSIDGFGGGWDRDQILSIMKDSRVGAYALVGLLLVLSAKVAALMSIADAPPLAVWRPQAVVRALVAAHVLGRWSSVPLMAWYPYVRPDDAGRPSAGRPFAGGTTSVQVAISTVLTLGIVIVAVDRRSAAVVLVAAAMTWLAGQYFHRKLGGVTGDALGAANQLVELSVYCVLAAQWSHS